MQCSSKTVDLWDLTFCLVYPRVFEIGINYLPIYFEAMLLQLHLSLFSILPWPGGSEESFQLRVMDKDH